MSATIKKRIEGRRVGTSGAGGRRRSHRCS
jgi:hypothetical protein